MSNVGLKERIYLFDTTLRDGAQTQGVEFSVEDKRRVAVTLDDLGIDYIEGGYPGASDTDTAFFAGRPAFEHARFTAFGMTKRSGLPVSNDPGFQALLLSAADAVCLVAKAWDYHVRVALGMSNEESVQGVIESVAAVSAAGKECLIDCEHFFDGYKSNREHALAVAWAAYESGARWVVLCDTNGGTLPGEIGPIVRDVARIVPGTHLGIHAHNDTGHAVANTLAAVRAGCRQIQGALNSHGTRCGNANLASIIPTLMLQSGFADRFEIAVTPAKLHKLAHASRVLGEIMDRAPSRQVACVDEGVVATRSGLHAPALLRALEVLENYVRMPPEALRGQRRVQNANQAGELNVLSDLAHFGISLDVDDPRAKKVIEAVKAREALGYAYEGAHASLELLARRLMGEVPRYFSVESFRVVVEKRRTALGQMIPVAEASVRVFISGESEPLWSVAEANGPVIALDQALRKDLGRYQPHIKDVELADYRVRVLTGGTEAVTRVLVESRDRGTGERWFTVGVSPNIVDASFEALVDAINYKLLKNNVDAAHALAS